MSADRSVPAAVARPIGRLRISSLARYLVTELRYQARGALAAAFFGALLLLLVVLSPLAVAACVAVYLGERRS